MKELKLDGDSAQVLFEENDENRKEKKDDQDLVVQLKSAANQ